MIHPSWILWLNEMWPLRAVFSHFSYLFLLLLSYAPPIMDYQQWFCGFPRFCKLLQSLLNCCWIVLCNLSLDLKRRKITVRFFTINSHCISVQYCIPSLAVHFWSFLRSRVDYWWKGIAGVRLNHRDTLIMWFKRMFYKIARTYKIITFWSPNRHYVSLLCQITQSIFASVSKLFFQSLKRNTDDQSTN